ncbi:hypothetical protein [Paenibacillus ihumii]|uniref:hypothetical protein n=1 Tax=Paenibacillus ihumii TaxID=687436 RepID=UPI0006D7B2A0|nr:hypothetical protein [Paenibacillus ihumii]
MSFDWGGFIGSLIGVFGAYGIAVWQISLQKKAEKPSKQSKTYKLSIQISEHLNSAWTYFTTENFQYAELFKNVMQFNHQLREYLPEAIGTDPRLVTLITGTVGGLSDISKDFSKKPRNHDNYMLYEEKLLLYTEVMRGKCHEIIDEIVQQNKQDF